MNFLSKLFGFNTPTKKRDTKKFGRYTDAYKSSEKYQKWDLSLDSFKEKNYLEGFRLLFDYLLDDGEGNIVVKETDSKVLNFVIYQGSKMIEGTASNEFIKAEAKISIVKRQNIAFLRRLLEINYSLKYCRFALDRDDNLTMVFYSKAVDASPYKIYYALKELATKADKQDDILEGEFRNLEAINNAHVIPSTPSEKQAKYAFFVAQMSKAIDLVDNSGYNFVKYPGAISYILLSTVYKMDYLIKPEGPLMEAFEKIHRDFFQHNQKTPQIKNAALLKEIKKLKAYEREEFNKEIYGVVSTFGITSPTGHERLAELIQNEIKNIDWYIKQKEESIALYICDYIVGYCLFNYSLPEPDKELLHLFYEILHPQYFKKLEFENVYWKKGAMVARNIENEIKRTTDIYKPIYNYGYPDLDLLEYDTTVAFAKSYLWMLSQWQITTNAN